MQKRIDWTAVFQGGWGRRFPNRLNLNASFACAFLLLTITPAYGGWGHRFTRSVLPSLVQRAAVSMIQQELYDLESDRSTGNSMPVNAPPVNAPRRVTAGRVAPSRTFTARSNPMLSSALSQSFQQGLAGGYSYEQLVSANVFESDPLQGSVFKRREKVKYIILHSTETGSPADARRVIQSWNNRGLRHPGAQFVVDRDGTICSTANPDLATVHIDTSKALAGYSNDNSVGIEIVRSGKQQYTRPQLDSVTYLVAYLQSHYGVPDSNVTTHHHVQPSDRSDPVGFDLVAFESDKTALETSAVAQGAHFNNVIQTAWTAGQNGVHGFSTGNFADPKSVLSTMPKPAPDFRLRRN